jgi:hypothetical protein
VLAAGGALVVSSQAEAQNGNGNSDMRIPVSKEPYVMPISVVTRVDIKGDDKTIEHRERMPVKAFHLADYLGLSEPQLAWFMLTRDTSQIAFARLAQQKVVNPQVREFAARIEAGRTYLNGRMLRVVNDEAHRDKSTTDGVRSEPMDDKDYERTRRRDLYAELENKASGTAWDAAYLQSQFFLTQNEIEVVWNNREVAKDNEMKSELRRRMDDLNRTAAELRTLTTNLGVNLP